MTFTASMGIYTCISCMKSNIACLLGLVSRQGGTMMSSEMEVFATGRIVHSPWL